MLRLISEESLCAKKLFLYEFSLNMLSHMNYVCIHSDITLVQHIYVTYVSFTFKSILKYYLNRVYKESL